MGAAGRRLKAGRKPSAKVFTGRLYGRIRPAARAPARSGRKG
jgi:hypothetical protein